MSDSSINLYLFPFIDSWIGDWQERQYKPLSTIDQLAVHFSMDGNMIHVESDEAKRQLQQKNKLDGTGMQ